MKKYTREFIETPELRFDFPYFLVPDDYKNKNTYHSKAVTTTVSERNELKDKIDAAMARIALALGKDVSKVSLPYKLLDGTTIQIDPYLKALAVGKDGPFPQAPEVVDSEGKPWEKSIKIPHQSRGRMKIEIIPHENSKDSGVGFFARLYAVQITELKQRTSFSSKKAPAATATPAQATTETNGNDGYDPSADF